MSQPDCSNPSIRPARLKYITPPRYNALGDMPFRESYAAMRRWRTHVARVQA